MRDVNETYFSRYNNCRWNCRRRSSNGGPPFVVETRGLQKTYFGKIDVPVLHGLDIKIREREFVAIIGQSGSGKSTLLNILGALDVPTGGTVLINGTDISTLDEDELASLRSDEVGFIFQAHYLLNEFTCLENALMPITIRHGEANEEQTNRVLRLLERVGLKIRSTNIRTK